MRELVKIYADFTTTEWEWVSHYIFCIKMAEKRSAVYTHIVIGEEREDDINRLLAELELTDVINILRSPNKSCIHQINIIIYGSKASGLGSIYFLKDECILCNCPKLLDNHETELFFSNFFINIYKMYESNDSSYYNNTLISAGEEVCRKFHL